MDPNQQNNTQPMMAGQAPPPAQGYPTQPYPPQPQPMAQPMQQPAPPPVQYQTTTTTYQPVPQMPGSGPMSGAPKANSAMFRGVTTSVFCECPSCGQATHTRVEVENSPMQWIICLIMFIFGLWLCCCIPFCIDSLKGGNHYCSNCGSSIGVIN